MMNNLLYLEKTCLHLKQLPNARTYKTNIKLLSYSLQK